MTEGFRLSSTPMESPSAAAPVAFAEGRVYQPDPKVLTIWRLSNLFGTFVFLLLAVPVAFFLGRTLESWAWWVPFVVVIGFGLYGQAVLTRQWQSWRYLLTSGTLEMEHGWLWRQRRVVRRERIQHVDFNSGPLDRRFGLVQVVVYTAGTTVGMIPGLTPETAEAFRAALVGRISDLRAEASLSEPALPEEA